MVGVHDSRVQDLVHVVGNFRDRPRSSRSIPLRDPIEHPQYQEAFLILGMLNWIPQWYRPTGPRTVSEIADHVNKILNSGIVDADHLRKREKSEGKHEVFDTSNE